MKRIASIGITGLAGILAAGVASAETKGRCEGLANYALNGGFVSSANVIAATDKDPAYCQVRATALPAISIEVRLPMEGWNGKYYQAGCGGFCGILGRADGQGAFINAMGPGLRKGYATATSDSGHHGMSVVDAAWAHNNPHGERDWGWRSIGETNRVAKEMIAAFYGGAPQHSYFQGCSTGGRMAHMVSLKYPDQFDGIISGAPAMDYTGLVALKHAWFTQVNVGSDGGAILPAGKDALIGDEVMKQCDSADGKSDGLIGDPRQCNVDLSVLKCSAGESSESCLSDAELGVVEKWRQGPVNSKGEQLYPGGIPEGSEPFWWLWLTGKVGGGGKLVPLFAKNFGAYMAFADDPGPSYSVMDFDFDKDPARLAAMASVYNSDDPDITKFQEAGGKMIVWHGWADAIVTPYKTVDWHEKVQAKLGGADKAAETVQLFMIPGMDHCGLLPGKDGLNQFSIDPLTALEEWVENGTVPTTIMK